jgi:hypothetical protein
VASQCVLQQHRLVGILVDCKGEGVAVNCHSQLQRLLRASLKAIKLSKKADASSMMSRPAL